MSSEPSIHRRRYRAWSSISACASVLLCSTTVAAQDTEVEWTSTCDNCRLVTSRVFSISSEVEEAGPIHSVWTVARDAAGRFWASFSGDGVPRVYTSQGTPIGEIGRIGDGPGEYRSVLAVIPVSDSILLFDPVLRRMTVVDSGLNAVRSVPLQGQVFSGVALDWPRVAINAQIAGGGASGHPFHILNLMTGEVEHSFGRPAGESRTSRDMWSIVGWIVKDSETGDLWTAMRTQFRIQRWDQQGRLIRTIAGLDDWFPDGARGSHGSPSQRPDGLVNAFATGKPGILYMALQAPASTWRSAWPTGSQSSAGHPSPAQSPKRASLYDSYLVALDASTGRILTIGSVGYEAMSNSQVQSSFLALDGLESVAPALIVVGIGMREQEH
jgi:hypothetical protein